MSGVVGMPLLLKRKYIFMMAHRDKTLEARMLQSTTSFAAKVRAGDTIVFQAGFKAAQRLGFAVTRRTLYSCASAMLAAESVERLVPGTTSAQDALHGDVLALVNTALVPP